MESPSGKRIAAGPVVVPPILIHPIRAVIFDLDGTLADTAGEIALALARAFGEIGVPPLPEPVVRELIGRGVASLVERALQRSGSPIAPGPVVARFEHHYASTVATAAVLYPSVREGLDRLAARAVPMAVVTNKPRLFTERLLHRLGVRSLFQVTVAGDDGHPRKPSGAMLLAACAQLGSAPGATLMLGDSANDVLAARAAGCPVWCVPYGYNEGLPVESLNADRIVATVDEAARLAPAGG